MLPNTPPTYVGTKRRTGPVDFHVNKMRALNLSAKYMKKVEDDLRGLPGSFSDLPMTPLMKIGEMADSNVFDQVNKTTGLNQSVDTSSVTIEHRSSSDRKCCMCL